MAEAETVPSLEARNEPKGLGKIPLGSLTERNKKRGILLELRGAGNLGSATDKPPAMRQQARGRLLRAGGFQRPAPAREAWRSGLPDVAPAPACSDIHHHRTQTAGLRKAAL